MDDSFDVEEFEAQIKSEDLESDFWLSNPEPRSRGTTRGTLSLEEELQEFSLVHDAYHYTRIVDEPRSSRISDVDLGFGFQGCAPALTVEQFTKRLPSIDSGWGTTMPRTSSPLKSTLGVGLASALTDISPLEESPESPLGTVIGSGRKDLNATFVSQSIAESTPVVPKGTITKKRRATVVLSRASPNGTVVTSPAEALDRTFDAVGPVQSDEIDDSAFVAENDSAPNATFVMPVASGGTVCEQTFLYTNGDDGLSPAESSSDGGQLSAPLDPTESESSSYAPSGGLASQGSVESVSSAVSAESGDSINYKQPLTLGRSMPDLAGKGQVGLGARSKFGARNLAQIRESALPRPGENGSAAKRGLPQSRLGRLPSGLAFKTAPTYRSETKLNETGRMAQQQFVRPSVPVVPNGVANQRRPTAMPARQPLGVGVGVGSRVRPPVTGSQYGRQTNANGQPQRINSASSLEVRSPGRDANYLQRPAPATRQPGVPNQVPNDGFATFRKPASAFSSRPKLPGEVTRQQPAPGAPPQPAPDAPHQQPAQNGSRIPAGRGIPMPASRGSMIARPQSKLPAPGAGTGIGMGPGPSAGSRIAKFGAGPSQR